ncbi:hypothetical protein [Streptomyces sp. NBC_01497]|uniref:hypothetical protein n=1 Tax=Streptomyces sp. NBC_01497 TaxID=2903885 RepID=UPI002E331F57|nr:hypothetical protein [Streptomyces sp. NBC_01497]
MAAHAAPTPRRGSTSRRAMLQGQHSAIALRLPLVLGIGYGAYASFLARAGGPASFTQLWLALASGVAFAAVMYAIIFAQPTMSRELRAPLWGVFLGTSVGFLRGLADFSVYRSVGFGLVIGAAVTVVTYYWWYTREQRADTRV